MSSDLRLMNNNKQMNKNPQKTKNNWNNYIQSSWDFNFSTIKKIRTVGFQLYDIKGKAKL